MSKTEDSVTQIEDEKIENVPTEKQLISKRQLKKLKKAELLQSTKAERRKQEKLKRKAKRAEKVLRNEDVGPSKKKLKLNTMSNSICRVRVAVDCSFDHLMSDRDITKLCQQLQYCYANNRRAPNPIQLYMTSIEGKSESRLEDIGCYKSWDVHTKKEALADVFPADEVVYLSSDSPNILETLSDNKVYVIGGLVDHNHHKGLCYRLAEERGYQHAQLPISNFLQLSCRSVLTVNHVFEILLKFTETSVWKDAFFSVIPKRKIITKEENNNDGDDDDDEEDVVNDDDDDGDKDDKVDDDKIDNNDAGSVSDKDDKVDDRIDNNDSGSDKNKDTLIEETFNNEETNNVKCNVEDTEVIKDANGNIACHDNTDVKENAKEDSNNDDEGDGNTI